MCHDAGPDARRHWRDHRRLEEVPPATVGWVGIACPRHGIVLYRESRYSAAKLDRVQRAPRPRRRNHLRSNILPCIGASPGVPKRERTRLLRLLPVLRRGMFPTIILSPVSVRLT